MQSPLIVELKSSGINAMLLAMGDLLSIILYSYNGSWAQGPQGPQGNRLFPYPPGPQEIDYFPTPQGPQEIVYFAGRIGGSVEN